jgi:bacillithiol biosynthesis cysteine-adding enzyme BshC
LREHGAEEWAKLLESAYRTSSLAEAFRQLIDSLFKDQDLLVLDADRPELKSAFAPIMLRELTENTAASAMKLSEQWLNEYGFPQQIKAREINLFYQTNDTRKRIVRDGEMWRAIDSPMHWNAHELQSHLSANPECFSPNVALRPVYQEVLLPNIAYVGGPGEIQYWLQLKPVFDAFDVQMPVVLLRDSAVLVNQASAKKWRKWGADENMFQSNFASELAKMVQEHAVDLTSAKQSMLDVMASLKQQLSEIDPSLVTAADMELKKQLEGLETLEKKMAKVIRQKEEIKSQQLKAFFDDIQPNGEPQDRYCNFIDVQAQFGIPLLPALLNAFDPVSRKLTIIVDADPNTTARELQH